MRSTVIGLTALMIGMCSGVTLGQTLEARPPGGTPSNVDMPAKQTESKSVEATPIMMPMTVEAGTPIKVAIDSEVRIRAVGQTIHGKTMEPVYAFDKLLIPVGTVVNGKVSAIDPVPKMTRTMQAANGNFSPVRKVHVQFDELVMADGKMVALHTFASPAQMECCASSLRMRRRRKRTKCRGPRRTKLAQRGKPYTSNGPACRTRSVNRERCTR